MAEDKFLINGRRVIWSKIVLIMSILLVQTGCSYLITTKEVPMPPKMWWENAMTLRNTVDSETGERSRVESSTFFATDPEAISTITLRNVSEEHYLRWEWLTPDGQQYYVTGKQPVMAKEGMYANEVVASHKILIAGDKAEKMYGDWAVNIYLDDQKIVSQNFTLKRESGSLGAWFIVDDYLDKNAYSSTELFSQFKSSPYLDKLIAEKAGKQKFRLDLIRGANTEKVSDDYRFKAKSSFTRNSEIKALVNLEEHDPEATDISWNLHLFLARKTSGSIENVISDMIIERLRQLKVDKIYVWEFCNTKPVEKTVYQEIFNKFRQKIKLVHIIIHDDDMFDNLYNKIYYQ